MNIPNYLQNYSDLYRQDPRAAAKQWFRGARYGLFLHFGIYSVPGRGEWLQLHENIPVKEYEKLKDQFTADGFDAETIARLAVESGMNYVNLTTRHHDSFCLFKTSETDFQALESPCGRDLIRELAEACDRHDLGLCLYYSHGRDWRHPHAPNNDLWGGRARPEYNPPEPSYATGSAHNLEHYVNFLENQIRELLTNYGPIAAIWLDGISVPLSDRSRTPFPQRPRQSTNARGWHVQRLYDLIHSLQPQVLVSYKQGLLGSEDFFAPEHSAVELESDAPQEICTTLCPSGKWGYFAETASAARSADKVWNLLETAAINHSNLLLNTAPLPDGSLNPEEVRVLREIGARIAKEGLPDNESTC